jgi:multidrug efflux system membrane fusion protein
MRPYWSVCGLALIAAGCSARQAAVPPKVPVSVARAELREVPYELTATGTVEPMQTVQVSAQVGGILQHVHFAEGDEVEAGQVLFEIDPRPYQAQLQQAQANLSRDVVQLANAQREVERYQALAASGFVTTEDYQQRQAACDALQASVRADSATVSGARLNLEWATVRAPIGGRTGSLLLKEGNLVRAGGPEPLVTINEVRPILIRFAVPVTQLSELQQRRGQALEVRARPGREGAPDIEGVLSFIDNHVDSATGTVLLKARFPNRDAALWPGEFVGVTLILAVQNDATVIPAQAVMNGQQGTYVFAVAPDGTAKQQPVTVARTQDSLAIIASGLAAGTLVVTDGQLRLTPNARVEIKGGPPEQPLVQSRPAPTRPGHARPGGGATSTAPRSAL